MLKGKRVSLRRGGRVEGRRGLPVCVVCAVVRLCAYLCVCLQGAKEVVQAKGVVTRVPLSIASDRKR